jgi:hypothetical protein
MKECNCSDTVFEKDKEWSSVCRGAINEVGLVVERNVLLEYQRTATEESFFFENREEDPKEGIKKETIRKYTTRYIKLLGAALARSVRNPAVSLACVYILELEKKRKGLVNQLTFERVTVTCLLLSLKWLFADEDRWFAKRPRTTPYGWHIWKLGTLGGRALCPLQVDETQKCFATTELSLLPQLERNYIRITSWSTLFLSQSVIDLYFQKFSLTEF